MTATVGVVWIEQYGGSECDLPYSEDNAMGLYNTLAAAKGFNLGDSVARARYFEQRDPVEKGSDHLFVERADLVFFVGHGTAYGLLFGAKAQADDSFLNCVEARWGDGHQLKWLVLDTCKLLEKATVHPNWEPAFAGIHAMLSFATTSYNCASRGTHFAQDLMNGFRIYDAWVRACEETEGPDVSWATLHADGGGSQTIDDHWPGKGGVSGPPSPIAKFTYRSGSC